jgi:hypothetical protein
VSERTDAAGPAEALDRTEHWFVRRGLPHLIAGYSASRDVLTRAVPILTLIFLVEVVNAPKRSFPIWLDVVAVVVGFAILLGAWMLANQLRHRPLLARPVDIGIFEVAVFVLAPPILPIIFGTQFMAALVTAGVNIALLLVVYLVTSYGIVPMTRWAAERTARSLITVVTLFVRALPLLLLFVTFLFLTNEVWQVSRGLVGPFYWIVLAAFLVVGTLFAVIRVPREVSRLAAFPSWDRVVELTAGTPAESLVDEIDSVRAQAEGPRLSRREWGNIGLVVLFSQALQVVLVSVMLFSFLVVFGVVVVTEPITESFLGAAPDVLATIDLWGRRMVVTEELLRVAGFLTAFSAFYFTVSVLTDDAYRDEFLTDVVDEVGRALAVRTVYFAALMQLGLRDQPPTGRTTLPAT